MVMHCSGNCQIDAQAYISGSLPAKKYSDV